MCIFFDCNVNLECGEMATNIVFGLGLEEGKEWEGRLINPSSPCLGKKIMGGKRGNTSPPLIPIIQFLFPPKLGVNGVEGK